MTFLPNKHIPLRSSILGLGALILHKLDQPSTVSGLWDRCRQSTEIASFERFTLAVDLLFALGAITMEGSVLVRVQ
jgi:hypothetical protein